MGAEAECVNVACHSLWFVSAASPPPVQASLWRATRGLDWTRRRCRTPFLYEGMAGCVCKAHRACGLPLVGADRFHFEKGGLAAGRFAPAFRLILRLENAADQHLRPGYPTRNSTAGPHQKTAVAQTQHRQRLKAVEVKRPPRITIGMEPSTSRPGAPLTRRMAAIMSICTARWCWLPACCRDGRSSR